jgi:hypothetical protein
MSKRKNKFKETVLMAWKLRKNLKTMTYLELDPEMMTEETPRDIIDDKWRREAILEAVSTLNERERSVIISRYIDDETLKVNAERLSLCTERIRQIEAKALRKLRLPIRSKQLAPYLDDMEARLHKREQERKKSEERSKRQSLSWMMGSRTREARKRLALATAREEERKEALDRKEKRDRFQVEWEIEHKEKYDFYNEVQTMISNVDRLKDITLKPRLFVGKCKCRDWHAEYRLLCEEFEIGCMKCLTVFDMEVKEKDEEIER